MLRHARTLSLAACAVFLAIAVPAMAIAAPRATAVQDAQARQTRLLDLALAGVQAPAPGKPQLYFVGFAGFGDQAVFKREVVAVRQLFDDHFATKGRSVALINHRSTLADTPLASIANLERTLAHLGTLMDKERDTLFLFLTSHGVEGLFAVAMRGFRFEHLTPDRLKEVLDRSGIQNRVIVVSACHAGSFLPALAGPRTLVIAAAAADRSSFGCEDRRQWTYFGDAYFNRALRQETSFTRAFERASQLIATWEEKDGLMPSLPQIAGGEDLPALGRD